MCVGMCMEFGVSIHINIFSILKITVLFSHYGSLWVGRESGIEQ